MPAVISVILVESEHERECGLDNGRDARQLDHADELFGRQM